MAFRIVSVKTVDDFILTDVEFTFSDGSRVIEPVPHFQPADKAEVLLSIENRYASEDRKQLATKRNAQIVAELSE